MIAVIGHDGEDLVRLTSRLHLHAHALEDCENRRHRSRSTGHALASIRKNARVMAAEPGSILYSILDHRVHLYPLTFRRRGPFSRIDR